MPSGDHGRPGALAGPSGTRGGAGGRGPGIWAGAPMPAGPALHPLRCLLAQRSIPLGSLCQLCPGHGAARGHRVLGQRGGRGHQSAGTPGRGGHRGCWGQQGAAASGCKQAGGRGPSPTWTPGYVMEDGCKQEEGPLEEGPGRGGIKAWCGTRVRAESCLLCVGPARSGVTPATGGGQGPRQHLLCGSLPHCGNWCQLAQVPAFIRSSFIHSRGFSDRVSGVQGSSLPQPPEWGDRPAPPCLVGPRF